jgi:hypothetical protein
LQKSNAQLLNLTGNPLLHFGFRDPVLLCDTVSHSTQPQSGCFTYGPSLSATVVTDRSGGNDEYAVVCQSLYYIGSQAWGISDAYASTGNIPPTTSMRIDADPSIVAYDSCTLPAFAYSVFAQPHQLILAVSSASSDSAKQLEIPQAWYGRSELAIPVAAPRCPDIGFEHNACGGYRGTDDSTSRYSINNWQCSLDGHDPRSYMCSRCFEEDGFIKDGSHCRLCSSASQCHWVIPVLLIGSLFIFVVYISKYADASSYLSSTLLYHMQMVAFLSRGPVGWSKFARDYFFSWMHVSNVDTTSLGCLWPAASQTYEQILIGSLCVPIVFCMIFSLLCIVLARLKRRSVDQASQVHDAWTVALLEFEPTSDDGGGFHEQTQVSSDDRQSRSVTVTVATRAFADHLWWKLNLYALYILYGIAPLTLRITQAFGSYTSIGVQNEHLAARLAVDLEVEYGGVHWQHSILPLALIGGVVYIIGIPLLLYLAIHDHLGSEAASAASFLTRVFQPNARLLRGAVSQSTLALWLLCSKGLLSILVGLTSHSSIVPMLFVVVLLLVMLVLVARSSPFVHHDDNVRNYLSFSVLIATYAGAALLSDESSENVTASQHLALLWILVLGNMGALGWILWTYVRKTMTCCVAAKE